MLVLSNIVVRINISSHKSLIFALHLFIVSSISVIGWLFIIIMALGIPAGVSYLFIMHKRGGRIRFVLICHNLSLTCVNKHHGL